MKELTIKEKAKAYDKALERAINLHKDAIDMGENIRAKQCEVIFPELAMSEENKIRKDLIEWFDDFPDIIWRGHYKKDVIAWLEKQGEQKPANSYCQENCKGFQETGKCFADGDCKAKREAESNDKNEPKFHEGDWVIYNNDICQIVKREEGCNILVTQFGVEKEPVNERNLSTAKLWDISDARDGDVLFHSDSASNGIFIFKEIIDKGFAKEVICYCDYDSEDHFCLGEHHTCCWTDAKILYPATKEQRDTLFAKMKEAGYTFDFEKKELKEIKQKPAEWSEEDESQMQGIIELLLGLSIRHNWLKSLKDRVQPQPKQDWSERDKEEFQIAIDTLAEAGQHDSAHWLKSLKDRIQPHKQWKPSEEQIKAFEHFVRSIGESGYVSPYENNTKLLYSLLEQLKKL